MFVDRQFSASGGMFSSACVALFLVALQCCLSLTRGEIRCYCNLPLCVTTGYMCKSSQNQCFTEHFSYSSDLTQSRHGCVEVLHHHKRELCTKGGSALESRFPTVLCCGEDMCNYVNTMDINIQVHTKPNHTHFPGIYGYGEDRHFFTSSHEAALQQDLWFKAAVIAVPIAGGFILIMLIFLATRMLKQDSKRQRQLLDRQRQFKAHLLFSDHHLKHGMYRNMDLSLSRDSCYAEVTEKHFIYDKGSFWFPWSRCKPPSTLV